MLIFQIKRIIKSEKWFNYIVTFFWKCQKCVGQTTLNGENREDGLIVAGMVAFILGMGALGFDVWAVAIQLSCSQFVQLRDLFSLVVGSWLGCGQWPLCGRSYTVGLRFQGECWVCFPQHATSPCNKCC